MPKTAFDSIRDALTKALPGFRGPKFILNKPFLFTYKDGQGRTAGFGGIITAFDVTPLGRVKLFVTTPKTGVEDEIISLIRETDDSRWYAHTRPFRSIYGELELIG